MAAGENLGAKFSIDITDLKTGLAQANRLIRNSESEFQAAAAGMDDWSSSAEGLQKRVDSLTDQVEIQKSKVAALVDEKQNIIDKMTAEGKSNEEIERAVDGVNKSIEREGKQLDRLQGSLKKNQAALDKMNDATEDAADSTDDLSDNAKDARKPLDKLTDTIEEQEDKLKDLKKQYANAVLEHGKNSKSAKKLGKEIDSLTKDLDKNKEKLEKTERATKEVGDGFKGLKTVAGVAAGAIAGIAAAAGAAVGAFLGLAESTRETRTNMGKVQTAFESAGFSAEQAANTYKDFYGVLGDEGQATEAVNLLSKLAKNEEQLAEYTTIATGIYAEFGDSLPIEGLIEAANETAKTGAVTGSLADALNWSTLSSEEWTEAFNGHPKALKKFQNALKGGATAEEAFNEALTKCTTESEREQVIRQALTLLYGESAAAYEENNAAVIEANKAQADLSATMAELGEKAEPIMTTLKQGFNDVLQAVLGLLEDVDWDAISASISNAFAYFIDSILPAIVDGIQWIIDNKDILIAGIAGVGTAFAAWNVVSLIQNVVGAMKGMTIAQAALNLVMSLNPIGLVIAAIAGLVAAFVVLWNKCDWFREFWIGLWETIKSAASIAWEAIKTFCTETIPQLISDIGTWFSELPGTIKKWLDNAIAKVTEWGTNLVSTGTQKATEFYNKIVEWVKKLPGEVWTWLSNTAAKVVTWGGDIATKGLEAAKKLLKSVTDKVKELPGEVWTWLSDTATKVKDWGGDLAAKGLEAATELWDSIVEKVSGLPDKIKSVGSDIVSGMWSGISDKAQWLKEKISGWAGNITSWAKGVLGIHSPSRVFADEVGANMALGVGVGFKDSMKGVSRDIKTALDGAVPDVGAGATGAHKGLASSPVGGVTVYQTNHYSQAHSRYELYKSKQQTAAAVRLAMGGA